MTFDEFTRKAVGVPFKEHGRDYDGWDCWGLVLSAYRDVLAINLPDYIYETTHKAAPLSRLFSDRLEDRWIKVTQTHPLAIATIYRRGVVIHVGLALPKRRIIHVEKGIDTCIEPVTNFRIEGHYAPA
jgi:hypothetical protein